MHGVKIIVQAAAAALGCFCYIKAMREQCYQEEVVLSAWLLGMCAAAFWIAQCI